MKKYVTLERTQTINIFFKSKLGELVLPDMKVQKVWYATVQGCKNCQMNRKLTSVEMKCFKGIWNFTEAVLQITEEAWTFQSMDLGQLVMHRGKNKIGALPSKKFVPGDFPL